MLVQHGRLAVQTGVEAENVFVVENGDVLEFTREYGDKIGKTYGGNVLVDGSGIGDVGEAVLRACLSEGLRVRALSRARPTLEDVFLAATRRSWDAVAEDPKDRGRS